MPSGPQGQDTRRLGHRQRRTPPPSPTPAPPRELGEGSYPRGHQEANTPAWIVLTFQASVAILRS